MSELTHFDEKGQAHMVDVGSKNETNRVAIAHGFIYMNSEAYALLKAGNSKKGDVLGVARIAGIQGVKATSQIIPLCHPLMLTSIKIEFFLNDEENSLETLVKVSTFGKTGVEMEALTGVNIALLTVYDMLKAVDKSMQMSNIKLLEKEGGKSGSFKQGR